MVYLVPIEFFVSGSSYDVLIASLRNIMAISLVVIIFLAKKKCYKIETLRNGDF
jgi:hypothetical protein